MKLYYKLQLALAVKSLPARERGLKSIVVSGQDRYPGVAPRAGAWVEILNCAL